MHKASPASKVRPWLRLSALAALAISPTFHARSADIEYQSGDINLISIDGEIKLGDGQKFEAITPDPTKKTAVLLASRGGNIVAALTIGETIHNLGYATIVPDGQICASACGLIWLGGSVRMVSETARIGFHAAYVGDGPNVETSGSGNAMVGAYLARLGLSYRAIAFLTSAPPANMEWLHPDQARDIGIDFVTVPAESSSEAWSAPKGATPEVATQPDHKPSPTASAMSATEARARNEVLSWYKLWSTSSSDMSYLAPYYPDTINYYGGKSPKPKVLLEKQKFAARWPVRNYVVRPDSISVTCSATCNVTGIVDWDVSSPQRGERSVGSANFAIELPRDSFLILGESGSVISGHKEPLISGQTPAGEVPTASAGASTAVVSQATTPSAAFSEGREARVEYQRWFDSITDDDYREGAKFWAGNRSNKPPPSCKAAAPSQIWLSGCVAAEAMLTPVDARRRSEPDFKAGWNSL